MEGGCDSGGSGGCNRGGYDSAGCNSGVRVNTLYLDEGLCDHGFGIHGHRAVTLSLVNDHRGI